MQQKYTRGYSFNMLVKFIILINNNTKKNPDLLIFICLPHNLKVEFEKVVGTTKTAKVLLDTLKVN